MQAVPLELPAVQWKHGAIVYLVHGLTVSGLFEQQLRFDVP